MESARKLVLLGVDGSDQSLEIVKYASSVLNLAQTEIVLFHVMDKAPDIFWDREKDPLVNKHMEYMKNWDAHKEAKIREFMDEARKLLVAAGVPADNVSLNVQKRKEGIARDILAESKFGYDMVMVGRKGLGMVDDAMLGSVASKVLIHTTEIPICLVGGKPSAKKILVAVDNSWGSKRAVSFAGKMLTGSAPSVEMVHVVRVPHAEGEQGNNEGLIKELQAEAESVMKPVFDKAAKTLIDCGVDASKIKTKVISGVGSRAAAIFEEAKSGRIGTVVVGRRGVSEVEEFNMGRVATKLTQLGKNVALWIVI